MKLHYDVISPFSRACLVIAHEVGLAGKIEIVPPGGVPPTTVHPGVSAANPIGKIPVLVTDHGHPLFDSRVIVEYLCHISGNKTLIPDDGVKRFRVLTVQAIGQGAADAGVSLRYETAMRPKEIQWQAWKDRQQQRILACAADLERNWAKDLAEATAGSLMAAVAYEYIGFRLPDIRWRDAHPALAGLLDKLSARPSMQATPLKA
jgi:glutathione S-transferase